MLTNIRSWREKIAAEEMIIVGLNQFWILFYLDDLQTCVMITRPTVSYN